MNLPARLVVVKGTEIFDAALGRYKDMPVTDVLQMVGSVALCIGAAPLWNPPAGPPPLPPPQMGRAGRPGFDTSGFAVILCAQEKKNFYHKFLYEPFPVESQLRAALADHLNAEIAGGSVRSRRDALDFLGYTYFFRRLPQNPAYYGLEDCSAAGITAFLETVVDEALDALQVSQGLKWPFDFSPHAARPSLQESSCVLLGDDAAASSGVGGVGGVGLAAALAVRNAIAPTTLGRIASYYCA